MEDIQFATEDGYDLPATLFESNAGRPAGGPVILISSATAVPRRAYRHFAQYLADNGARAVMTYDYRGMNGRVSNLGLRRMRMSDWATRDMPAAVRELRRRYRDAPMAGLGHSFGGQALGLSGCANHFARYMTLAAGSGYLPALKEPTRNWISLNLIGYPLAAALGYLPRWAGLGADIPFGVFDQWRRWCNRPDYFMSDPEVPESERFEQVRLTMVAVGFEDDPLATLEATRALMGWYSRADIKLKWFTREDAHGPIGHFGFFRPDHRETLWPQVADWLTQR